MEAIRIPYSEIRARPDDFDLIDMNSRAMFFDSGTSSVIVFDPNDILLEELSARGIKYEKLKEDEIRRYADAYFRG